MTQPRTIIVWSSIKALLVLTILLSVGTMPAYAQEAVTPYAEAARDFTTTTTQAAAQGSIPTWGKILLVLLVLAVLVALVRHFSRPNAPTTPVADETRTPENPGAPDPSHPAPADEPAHEPQGPRPVPPAASGSGHTGHAILPFILAAAGTLGFAAMASAQGITAIHPATMVKGGGLQGYTLSVTGTCDPERVITNQAPNVIMITPGSLKRHGDRIKFDARATDTASESVTQVKVLCKGGANLSTGNKALLAVVPAATNYVLHQANARSNNELQPLRNEIAQLRKDIDALKASDKTTATAIARLTQTSSTHATTAYVDSQATALRNTVTSTHDALLARIEAAENQARGATTAANNASLTIRDQVVPRIAAAEQNTASLVTAIGSIAGTQASTLERLLDLKKRGFLGLRENPQFKEGSEEHTAITDAIARMKAIADAAALGKKEGGQ